MLIWLRYDIIVYKGALTVLCSLRPFQLFFFVSEVLAAVLVQLITAVCARLVIT